MEIVSVSRRIKSSPILPHTSGGGNTFPLNSLPLNDPFRRNSAADAASLLPTPGHIPSPMRRAGAAVRSGSLSTHLCCQRKAAPDCPCFPCIRRPHSAIPGHFPGPGKARGSPSLRFFSGRFQKKKRPQGGSGAPAPPLPAASTAEFSSQASGAVGNAAAAADIFWHKDNGGSAKPHG